MDVQTEKKVKH